MRQGPGYGDVAIGVPRQVLTDVQETGHGFRW